MTGNDGCVDAENPEEQPRELGLIALQRLFARAGSSPGRSIRIRMPGLAAAASREGTVALEPFGPRHRHEAGARCRP